MLTTITFEKHPSFTIVGDLKAINPLRKHDEIFDCDVKIFKDKGEFRQRIKLLTANPVIKGVIEGQTCTEVDGRCIPFEVDFEVTGIAVTGKSKLEEVQKEEENNQAGKAEKGPFCRRRIGFADLNRHMNNLADYFFLVKKTTPVYNEDCIGLPISLIPKCF